MANKVDFKLIAARALASVDSLLNTWLPGGKREGHEYKALNPVRSDRKVGSFSINTKTGAWADFADDAKGGDLISLYAYLHSLEPLAAAIEVAGQVGVDIPGRAPKSAQGKAARAVKAVSKPVAEDAGKWAPMLPVPEGAPPPPKAHPFRGIPNFVWYYRDGLGQLLGMVCRFYDSENQKVTVPLTFCRHSKTGALGWRWISFPDPRPLYIPSLVFAAGKARLIVEGEKCADVAHELLRDRFDVATWPGGGKAVHKADWSAFGAGDKVIIWPDCDAQHEKLTPEEKARGVTPESKPLLPEKKQPGVVAADKIAKILIERGCVVRMVGIPAPGTVPDGWDIADAASDGQTVEQINLFIRGALREPTFPEPDSPSPLLDEKTPEETVVSLPQISTLLAHFALIYGKTDVWDGLNRQLMKKTGFIAAFGRDLAKEWLEHPHRRTLDAAALPRLKRGRAVEGGAGGDRLSEMLPRFTLLYGTVTVWDNVINEVLSLESLRAAYSVDVVKRWQEHQARHIIDAKNLVFDPTQKVSPDTHINMFDGFPVHPQADEKLCQPIIDLLYELCSSEEDGAAAADWILKWLAYPLQHPGAKMQTAILMFGEKQGTGKSLFFEGVVRAIYGEYGTTAGQHQLDSQFTEWRSRKLFVLFEEVLSRSDRYNHLGTIKHMITGRDMRINPKNLPERVESNHLNSAFLSNEPQPIPIELEDRRIMVVEARNFISDQFKNEIVLAINGGGIAAFYHYLLNYDLGNFGPHTKPLATRAKSKIIDFGMPGWEVFHRSWRDCLLSVPYCSCVTEDLYVVYRRWCDKAYEKPLTLTKFSSLLSNRETKFRTSVLRGSKSKQLTIFKIELPDKAETVSDQCEKFRQAADIKAGD